MNKGLLLLIAGVAAYMLLKKKPAPSEELIQAWIEKMKVTPEWIAVEIEKAAANGITLDEQLRIDALWVIDQGWVLT